jgi:hypothetical protein
VIPSSLGKLQRLEKLYVKAMIRDSIYIYINDGIGSA